jgi:hypothetical protein
MRIGKLIRGAELNMGQLLGDAEMNMAGRHPRAGSLSFLLLYLILLNCVFILYIAQLYGDAVA